MAVSNGRRPEFFLLESEGSSIINFDISYLVATYNIMGTVPFADPNSQLVAFAEYSKILDFVLMFFPADWLDDQQTATLKRNTSKLQAQIPDTLYFPMAGPSDLEMMDYDEYCFVLWYFFCCHEFGHHIIRHNDFESLKLGGLDKIMALSTSNWRGFLSKQQQKLHVSEKFAFFPHQTRAFDTLNDVELENLRKEVLCDQIAVVLLFRMGRTLTSSGFPSFGPSTYLFHSLFSVFLGHLQLSEFKKIPEYLTSVDSIERESIDQLLFEHQVRFEAMRDFCACVAPQELNEELWSTGGPPPVFGWYGSLGIREIAQIEFERKELHFDPLLKLIMNGLLDGL